jgi:hypothetical protein
VDDAASSTGLRLRVGPLAVQWHISGCAPSSDVATAAPTGGAGGAGGGGSVDDTLSSTGQSGPYRPVRRPRAHACLPTNKWFCHFPSAQYGTGSRAASPMSGAVGHCCNKIPGASKTDYKTCKDKGLKDNWLLIILRMDWKICMLKV